jgi:hypothetical protein
LSEWSRDLGIKRTTLRNRLDHHWPIDKALTVPIQKRSPKRPA